MSMRDTLISNIEALVAAYGGHISISTFSALRAIGVPKHDASHVTRVVADRKNFTVDIYDRTVQAFSNAWPENVAWPDGIDRPPPDTGAEQQDDIEAA